MIHKSSIIDAKAKIGKNVDIGPGVVVDSDAIIGDGS